MNLIAHGARHVTRRFFTSLWTGCNIAPIWGGMTHDDQLDATGLLCPLPVLKIRKRLQSLNAGQVLRVEADDPVAVVDVPHFCDEAGHELVDRLQQGDVQIYLIRKGG